MPSAAEPAAAPAHSMSIAVGEQTAEGGAVRSAGSWLRLGITAVAGLALDLWSKAWAFHTLRQGDTREVLPHVLEFQTLLNPGALFGIGAGRTEVFLVASVAATGLVLWMFAQTSPRRWMLQVALGAILAGALGNMYDRVFVKLADMRLASPRGYNVYGRVTEQGPNEYLIREYPLETGGAPRVVDQKPDEIGYVRDFIKIPTTLPLWSVIPVRFQGRELWPWVFNVADTLLVGGVAILALHIWRDSKPGGKKRQGDDPGGVAEGGGSAIGGASGGPPAGAV